MWPKRDRKGFPRRPARVVAPTSVKGGNWNFNARAAGPCPRTGLLHGLAQAVDLVNEEEVSFLEVRDDGREVAPAFDDGPRRGLDLGSHGARDDVGQGGLSQARRTHEEQVLERLASLLGGPEHHFEQFDVLPLSDVLVQVLGPEVDLLLDLLRFGLELGVDQFATHGALRTGSGP